MCGKWFRGRETPGSASARDERGTVIWEAVLVDRTEETVL
jgi:hypothetical protein